MPLILPFRRILGIAPVVPGSVSYTTVGTFTFIVPRYGSLVVDVRGAGGGAGGGAYYNDPGGFAQGGTGLGVNVVNAGPGAQYTYMYGGAGSGGGYSHFYLAGFYQVLGNAGTGGSAGTDYLGSGLAPAGGAGTGVGGDTNSTGGGSAGGTYGYSQGYSGWFGTSTGYGSYGGNGGRAVKTFTPGQLPVGASVQIIVGQGGAAGYQYTGPQYPTAGLNGAVYISWS